MSDLKQELDALFSTINHIDEVSKLLLIAQHEISKRIVTHDRSKLRSPEWETFAEVTSKLKDLVYGSEEYNQQLKDMDVALNHHYSHNRHHPQYYTDLPISTENQKEIEYIDELISNLNSIELRFELDHRAFDAIEKVTNRLEISKKELESDINKMNIFDILEMLFDWLAATKRHSTGNINDSIAINQNRFDINPQLSHIFRNTIKNFQDYFEDLITQLDIYDDE